MEIITSIILTLIASISTLIGYLFVYFNVKNINKCICISLSFCASIMFLISLKELLPISIKYILINNNIYNALIILISIPIIIYLMINILNKNNYTNNLYRVGVVTFIAMIIHNTLEGLITLLTSLINTKLGIKIALAIIAHNIPEGIIISTLIYYSTNSKRRAFIYTLIAALSELFGALIIYYLFKSFINAYILNIFIYITGSLMIIISITELYKESLSYNNYLWFMIGILLSLFILIT